MTLATLGQFAFVWLYLMAKQAKLSGKELITDTKVFCCLYIVYFTACFWGLYQNLLGNKHFISENMYFFWSIMAIAFYLLWLTGKWLVKVANHIRGKSIELPNNIILLILIPFYALAFPLLQSKLNHAYSKSA